MCHLFGRAPSHVLIWNASAGIDVVDGPVHRALALKQARAQRARLSFCRHPLSIPIGNTC